MLPIMNGEKNLILLYYYKSTSYGFYEMNIAGLMKIIWKLMLYLCYLLLNYLLKNNEDSP